VTEFYDHFLKRGKWDSRQAALIFNGKDPRLYERKISFPAKDNDYSRVKLNTWQWKAIDYYHIFETAEQSDWERCGADVSNPNFWFHTYKTASPRVFITLAKDKQLELPSELLEKWATENNISSSKREDESSHTPTDQPDPITEDQDDKVEGGGRCDMYPPFGDGKKNTGREWREPAKQLSIKFAEEYSDDDKNTIAGYVLEELKKRNWKGRGGKEIKISSVLKNGIDESLTFESL